MRRTSLVLAAALSLAAVPALAAPPLKTQLPQRTVLNLAAAERIAAAAVAKAREQNLTVSIAIVDEAGRLMHFQRMDGTPNSSVEVAIGKAVHAADYRRDSGFHQKLLEGGNNVVLALPRSLPIEGGVRLLLDTQVVGAIGVSGAQAAQDGQIAQAGADLLK